MAGNVSIETDAADNWKPSKKKSRERIDGIVALIMALDRASRQEEFTSVYDKRGPLFLTMSDEWVNGERDRVLCLSESRRLDAVEEDEPGADRQDRGADHGARAGDGWGQAVLVTGEWRVALGQ